MKYYKLFATTKSYIWGGKKLFSFHKESNEDTIAESWELLFDQKVNPLLIQKTV